MGQVHPGVAADYGIKRDAYVGVLDLKTISAIVKDDVKYRGMARFPAVTRDISLVMKKEIPAGLVESLIRENAGKLLEAYKLFDIYEGENVGEDEKSLAYTIRFRAADRTLEEVDVSGVMDKILKSLEEKGIVLRS